MRQQRADTGRTDRLINVFIRDARRVFANTARGTGARASARPPDTDNDEQSERIRELVEPHLFYVVQVAGSLSSRTVPFEDLLAAGNVGLVEAAHRFDPSQKVKFLTYASWWIRKRMLDLVTRDGRSIRLTRYARERRQIVDRTRSRLRQELGREPETEEIATATGLDPKDVASAAGDRLVVLSLERDRETLRDEVKEGSLVDWRSSSPEEQVEREELRRALQVELQRLPRRQRQLLERRFGLNGASSLTFQELGERLGLSRERVRQIERDTLASLRRRLQARFRPAAGPPIRSRGTGKAPRSLDGSASGSHHGS